MVANNRNSAPDNSGQIHPRSEQEFPGKLGTKHFSCQIRVGKPVVLRLLVLTGGRPKGHYLISLEFHFVKLTKNMLSKRWAESV
jgi:hypothetical protein